MMNQAGGISLLVIVMLVTIIEHTNAIKCYRCTVARLSRENTTHLCQDFKEINDFEVDCPFSTMCMKVVFRYQPLDGPEIVTVSRDCAYQKAENQEWQYNAWHKVASIVEPYEVGCKQHESNEDAQYCHCRGALCNAASTLKDPAGIHADAMAVIFVFNAMRYLRTRFD